MGYIEVETCKTCFLFSFLLFFYVFHFKIITLVYNSLAKNRRRGSKEYKQSNFICILRVVLQWRLIVYYCFLFNYVVVRIYFGKEMIGLSMAGLVSSYRHYYVFKSSILIQVIVFDDVFRGGDSVPVMQNSIFILDLTQHHCVCFNCLFL
jgi:hypothetical protein